MHRFTAPTSCRRICVLVLGLLAAACTSMQTTSERSLPAPQYTLAVLPWNMSPLRYEESLAYGTSALQGALRHSAFRPVFSYYELPHYPATTLPHNQVQDAEILWGQRYPGNDPHADVAFRLGDTLGVDAVLMYAMEPNPGPDAMWVYLFDIPQRKTYSASGRTVCYEIDAIDEMRSMTRRVLAQFARHRRRIASQ